MGERSKAGATPTGAPADVSTTANALWISSLAYRSSVSPFAVTTDEETGQPHAGAYAVAAKRWRWLKSTPWEQSSDVITADGRTMLVRTNDDGRSTLSRVDLGTMSEKELALDPGRNSSVGSSRSHQTGNGCW